MLEEIQITKKMLFKFGWGKNWGSKTFYFGYPYFTEDAAKYLISQNVELIAYDAPSPDDSRTKLGSSEDSIIHKIFLENNIILVEYLANLDQIKELNGWSISANPLKIKGGDGSPARVFIFK